MIRCDKCVCLPRKTKCTLLIDKFILSLVIQKGALFFSCLILSILYLFTHEMVIVLKHMI